MFADVLYPVRYSICGGDLISLRMPVSDASRTRIQKPSRTIRAFTHSPTGRTMAEIPKAAMQTQIRRLLRPRSIAIVGASAKPGTIGSLILANLLKMGFPGEIHLVSRSRADINGRPCGPTIDDLPEGIDSGALVVPEAAMEESIAACARRRAGGVIALAAWC